MTQEQAFDEMPKRRFFKRSARRLLVSDWLCQILAFVIVGACYVGVRQFGASLVTLILNLSGNRYLASLIQSAYLVFVAAFYIPLIVGICYFEVKAVEGKSNICDVFFAFLSVKNLTFAYNLFFYTLCKVFLYLLPATVMSVFLSVFYYDGIFLLTASFAGVDLVYFVFSALVCVLWCVGFVLSSKCFVGVYVSLVRQDTPFKECFLIANNCIYVERSFLAETALSFVPLCIISLFTVGFLFVCYTLPYVFITFTMISRYAYSAEMINKRTIQFMYDVYDENDVNEENPKGSI